MIEKLTHGMDLEKKAIILGNGPSLRGFDFSRLSQFDVFGMNAAYRYWDEINWYPQYYSCLDLVVGLSHAEQIKRLVETSDDNGIRLFLLRENLINEITPCAHQSRIINFDELQRSAYVLSAAPITTGSHTTAWATLLGYRELYLLGIDCNYEEIVPGAQSTQGYELEIVEESRNPNYFFDGYQRPGDKYNIPNPQKDLHLRSWRQVARLLAHESARVLNANAVSKVDAFEFCTFEDVEQAKQETQDFSPQGNRLHRLMSAFIQYVLFCLRSFRRHPFLVGGPIILGVVLPLSLLMFVQHETPLAWASMALAAITTLSVSNVMAFAFARSLYGPKQ